MTAHSEKFYDRLTFLYPVVDLFLQFQKPTFFRMVNHFPPGRLLEIGVGNGAHFNYYTAHEITGIDTSRNMLARARGRLRPDIELFHMNGEALLFPNEVFDYVVLSHVITVVDDPEKLLEEICRVLKPRGKIFILNHFTPDNWLKYLDQTVESISRLACFKSVFHISGLRALKKFTLLKESDAGLFSYFKILVYEKNL